MTLRLLVFFASVLGAQAAQITINYSARLINGTQTGLNALLQPESSPGTVFAINDFLSQFGLQTEPGPTGVELPFSGSFTYQHPQVPLPGSGPNWGVYALDSFSINGVPLVLGTAVLNVILNAQGVDQYALGIFNASTAAGDGALRSLRLEMIAELPLGTFPSNALPADAGLLASATATGGLLIYDVQAPGELTRRFSNNVMLNSGSQAAAVPEPHSWYLGLGGMALLWLRRRLRRLVPARRRQKTSSRGSASSSSA